MKLENLLFSLLVLLVAVVCLAVVGWGLSFMWSIDLTLLDGGEPTDTWLFIARFYIGLVLVGLINGMSKLWDLFMFCMTFAPTGHK